MGLAFLLVLRMNCAAMAAGDVEDSATFSNLLESYRNQLTNEAAVAYQLGQRVDIVIENAPLCEYLNKNPKDTALRAQTIALASQYANSVADWAATPKDSAGCPSFVGARHSKARVLWAWQVLFLLNVLHDGMSFTNAVQILGEPNRGGKEWEEDLTNRIWWQHPASIFLFARQQTNDVYFDPIFGSYPHIRGGNPVNTPLTERDGIAALLRSLREQLVNGSIAAANTPEMSQYFPREPLLGYVQAHPEDTALRDEVVKLTKHYANAKQSQPWGAGGASVFVTYRVQWAWDMLLELGILHDGMTLADAKAILGEPTPRPSRHWMWYVPSMSHHSTELDAIEDGAGLVFVDTMDRPLAKRREANKVRAIGTNAPILQH